MWGVGQRDAKVSKEEEKERALTREPYFFFSFVRRVCASVWDGANKQV